MSKETAQTIIKCIKSEVYPLFPQIAVILNSNLSDNNENEPRFNLVCAFIRVFLYQLSPDLSQIVSHLTTEVEVSDILYGDFCHFISSPTVDSALSDYDVQFAKRTLDCIRAFERQVQHRHIG